VREGWPEPPAIRLREAFPGEADGLAGESSANKVNCGSSSCIGTGSCPCKRAIRVGKSSSDERRSFPAERVLAPFQSVAFGAGQ
jgi:hypothetical protein